MNIFNEYLAPIFVAHGYLSDSKLDDSQYSHNNIIIILLYCDRKT